MTQNQNYSPTDNSLSVEELKDQGNVFVKEEKYSEALISYTKAIQIAEQNKSSEPIISILYSNRSLVNLKLKKYYLALVDANRAILLNGNWPKAYYRKAEVYFHSGNYGSALLWYGSAMQLDPGNQALLLSAQKAAAMNRQQSEYEKRIPYVGCGIGIIIGVIIALLDKFYTNQSAINNPILMVIFVFIIASIGYLIARFIKYYKQNTRESFLECPEDYVKHIEEQNEELDNEQRSNKPKYTKAQARMRYKRGKL